jgi:hypothetical protein
VTIIRAPNLALKFALELAAIGAFAYWGASIGGTAISVLLAIAAPALAIALWGVFAAPRSERRLHLKARVPFELSVFCLATLAWIAAGAPVAAAVFAIAVVVNAVLMTVLEQWEA